MTRPRSQHPSTSWAWRLVAPCLLLLSLVGCTRESHRVDLVEVPTPPGGNVSTLARLDPDAEGEPASLVATSPSHLYVRPENGSRWEARSIPWPDRILSPGRPPTAGISPPRASFNFPRSTRLTTYEGRIWMLTRPRADRGPVLMVGHDAARSWSLAPLPPFYRRRSPIDRGNDSDSIDLTRIDTRTPPRLSNHGRHGLYLLDGHRIWRAVFEEDAPKTLRRWQPLDLSGLQPHEGPAGRDFPSVIRNYLPATEDRPFELLTVFGERLYVYRRQKGAERWILVSTLPAIDRQLFGYAGTDLVYLLSPETLYRTTDRGERWTGLPLSRDLNRSEITTAAFLDEPDDPDAAPERPGLPTVLLGTDTGSIYRSQYERQNEAEDVWEPVRPPDPDGRAITHLVASPGGRDVWASTEGLGLLRSTDGGRNWSRASRGFRATRPLDLAIGSHGAPLLGTESGLFRLTGAPEEGHWSRLHGRASSALVRRREPNRIFTGTFGGAIVSEAADGPVVPGRKDAPSPRMPPPLFQPWSAPTLPLPASAVLSIRERPNAETLFAWTHQQGLLTSSDDGVSWWHTPLNPGLLSTLRRSVVTNFVVGRGRHMYLTSHSLDRSSTPARLWRSSNDGETWHSVHTFSDSFPGAPFLLRRAARPVGNTLYFAHGDRLARSTNAGDSWTELQGPWTGGRIYAYAVEDDRQTLVYNTRNATRIAFLSDVADTRRPDIRSYQLDWPAQSELHRPNVRRVVRHQRFVYVATSSSLFAGIIPEQRVQVPNAPTIIVTLLFMLAVTGASFWYLRRPTG
jgi:photosystem II stability/assembly factor-like uncharacterized protein